MAIREDVVLNLSKQTEYISIRLQQNDALEKEIDVTIINDGEIYDIPASAIVMLKMLKTDGSPIAHKCEVVDNKVRFTINEQMTAVKDRQPAQIKIINPTTGGTLKTLRFHMLIDEEVLSDHMITSVGEFSLLDDALMRVLDAEDILTDAIVNVEQAITAESTRKTNENIRVSNEEERIINEELRPNYYYVTQAEYDALPLADKNNPKYVYEITDDDGVLPTELENLITRTQTAASVAEGLVINKAGINDLSPTNTEAYSGNKVQNKFDQLDSSLGTVASQLEQITINVKNFGAKGNAHIYDTMTQKFYTDSSLSEISSDDTPYIQSAIDSLDNGGTVFIPKGDYSIRVGNGAGFGIVLKSNIKLLLDSQAIIKLIPTSQEVYYGIFIPRDSENVIVSGGQIFGEREHHIGTTGEWGFGILCRASKNVIIENIKIKDCWGDGIDITSSGETDDKKSKDVIIRNVVCENNRRNNLTLGGVEHIVIEHSKFVSANGTAPEAGIDIEPDNANRFNKDVTIFNCVIDNNKAYGVLCTSFESNNITIKESYIKSSITGKALVLTKTVGNNSVENSEIIGGSRDCYNINFENCIFSIDGTYSTSILFQSIATSKNNFNKCVFNITNKVGIETTGVLKKFKDCIFNFNGTPVAKSLLISGEINIENCTFNNLSTSETYTLEITPTSNSILNDLTVGERFSLPRGKNYFVTHSANFPQNRDEYYAKGCIIYNSLPTVGSSIGWVCVESGRAHKPTEGYLTIGNVKVTSMTNVNDWFVGMPIKCQGIPEGTTVAFRASDLSFINLSNPPTEQGMFDLYDAKFVPFGAI